MTFRLWRSIVAPDPKQISQAIVVDRETGELYGMQAVQRAGSVDDLWFTRYTKEGRPTGRQMRVTGGRSHGAVLYAVGGRLDFDLNGRRTRLQFQPGKTFPASELSGDRFRVDARAVNVEPAGWLQGEVRVGDNVFRLYGVPWKANGPSLNPDGSKKPVVPGRVELIRDRSIVRRASVAHLGRVGLTSKGKPIGGRLEPEGISTARIDGKDQLVVGITTGSLSKGQTHQLYVEPLSIWLDRPHVSLAALTAAARADPARGQGETTPGAADDVRVVENALQRAGLLGQEYAADGSFGSTTRDAYAAWQRKLGYSGADADGLPGRTSLTALGVSAAYGFDVID